MAFIFNDGGRLAAGYKGHAGDCGARALSIALKIDYKIAYQMLANKNAEWGYAKSARNGIQKTLYDWVLKDLGYKWYSSPKFVGRKAYCSDMPKGIVIARQAGHFVAVIDGIPHDTWDSSEKMVYGYWAIA
jgi:hypothetical protein